jgi:uncharacterized protein (DUF1800 family)
MPKLFAWTRAKVVMVETQFQPHTNLTNPFHPIGKPARLRALWAIALAATLAAVLAACGGGGGGGSGGTGPAAIDLSQPKPTSLTDATRLADQASMGNTEALQAEIMQNGPAFWVNMQMGLSSSRYTLGGNDTIHTAKVDDFCRNTRPNDANCWRDYFSSEPLLWDFYRNALRQGDQLRQRVALALKQIVVISNYEVEGTYGQREYHNMLLDNSFGNYRDILYKVALSPAMGDYLDNVNNDKDKPNENFARELLQLFALGTCELNEDGSLKSGQCVPTYNNDIVRNYAYALTGWTFPPGGQSRDGNCWPERANCRYQKGDMVPRRDSHDANERVLLGGSKKPASSTAPQALELVLDSLMNHPNIGPFIGKQLIQHLVTSNPSGAYVQRVANAFNTGKYGPFGAGKKGDMKATVAAVLLDEEARREAPDANFARLREPALVFTGTLRAMNGQTDGEPFGYWQGGGLRQHMFRSPSVFNFYPPDYPLAGTQLKAPQFGILNANTGLARMNYVNWLIYNSHDRKTNNRRDTSIPGAVPTIINLSSFDADADDPAKLVDRLAKVAFAGRWSPAARQAVIDAVAAWQTKNMDGPNEDGQGYKRERVKAAAYLIFSSPQYNVVR